jgi:transcriptional regulator with AAA-type ATPase domain
MSALVKNERTISTGLDATLGLTGVREDDEMVINIFHESKKSYKLNRFRYKIKSAEKFQFDFINSIISLPYFLQDQCSFELILVTKEKNNNFNQDARYLLKSTGSVPFKLNGNWTFEAFLDRGDIVDIGFNRICFYEQKIERVKLDQTLIPDAIVSSNLPILLEGETGTGKTTLAKKIHEESGVDGDFIHLNIASFAPSLIESELFGHVKGAFTGAFTNKRGAFLQAHRGTLFLDEIDSLPRELQTKLLLFLEDCSVRPVGSDLSQVVQVRLIFASGSDLLKLIEKQKMRIDFYYRIKSGYSVKLKSFYEDKKSIRKYCEDFQVLEQVQFSEDLISFYEEINWPGNIRQLYSHLKKKKILANGKKIIFNSFDEELLLLSGKASEESSIRPLEQIKHDYCLQNYFKMGKNVKKCSEVLQISQNTLRAILKNEILRS